MPNNTSMSKFTCSLGFGILIRCLFQLKQFNAFHNGTIICFIMAPNPTGVGGGAVIYLKSTISHKRFGDENDYAVTGEHQFQ